MFAKNKMDENVCQILHMTLSHTSTTFMFPGMLLGKL